MVSEYALSENTSNKIRNMGIVCAFLVVVIHCRPEFEFGTFGWWIKELLENGVCNIAVPFFFIVSGFMLAREYNVCGYNSLLSKRIRTLVIPFFSWNILYKIFDLSIGNISNFMHARPLAFLMPSLSDFGLWYTGLPMLTPLWYVRALLILCLISPLLIRGIRKTGLFFCALLFMIYAMVCPFVPMPNYGQVENFARIGILPVLGLFYFSVGIYIYENSKKTFRLPNSFVSLVIGVALVVTRAIFVYFNIAYSHYVGFACIPFALYGIWGLVSCNKWPSFIVMSAFGVYVIHKFILGMIVLFVSTDKNVFSYLGAAIVAFACSLCIVILMKKIMPRLSFYLFGGR